MRVFFGVTHTDAKSGGAGLGSANGFGLRGGLGAPWG